MIPIPIVILLVVINIAAMLISVFSGFYFARYYFKANQKKEDELEKKAVGILQKFSDIVTDKLTHKPEDKNDSWYA